MQLQNKQASIPPHVHITITMQPPIKITERKIQIQICEIKNQKVALATKYLELKYFDKDGYF